jgi:hypothetical protein
MSFVQKCGCFAHVYLCMFILTEDVLLLSVLLAHGVPYKSSQDVGTVFCVCVYRFVCVQLVAVQA